MSALDAEEQALLESVENGEWQSVPNTRLEIQRYQQYARSQVLEEIKIELPIEDVRSLQHLAQQTGASVSSLIATAIHQYVVRQSSSQS